MKRIAFIALVLISTLASAQTNNFKWISQQTYVATGTNTYAVNIPGYSANTIGSEVKVLFTNGNTGASTLQIGSLAAVTLRKNGSSALSSGDLLPGATYRLTFDGTYFQVLGLGGSGGGGSVAWGDVTDKPNFDSLYWKTSGTTNLSGNVTSLWVGDSTNIEMNFSRGWGELFDIKIWKGDISYGSIFSLGYDFVEFYNQSSPLDPQGMSTNGFAVGNGVSFYSTDFNTFGSKVYFRDTIKISSFHRTQFFKQNEEDPFSETDPTLVVDIGNDLRLPTIAANPTETWAVTIDEDGVIGSQPISGGGATNLAFTPSPTNGIVTSDTGTDATIPLGNGTNSGLSLNDYTTGEKSKLAGIATGATAYTDELAQDAVGGMVDGSLTYVDGTPLLQRAALTGAITASAGSNTTALGSFTKAQLDGAVSDGNVQYVGDAPTAHTLDSHSNVTITANTSGELLQWNGSAWLNRTLAEAGIQASGSYEVTTNKATDVATMNNTLYPTTQALTAKRTVTSSGSIVQADNFKTIYFNSASPINFTIDALTIGTDVAMINIGAGAVTFVNGTATASGAASLPGASGGNYPSALITYVSSAAPIIMASGSGGSGDVVGPASAIDGEAVVFDGTTGKIVKRPTGTAKFPILGLATTTFGTNEVPYSSGIGNTLASSSSFTWTGTSLNATQFNGVPLTASGDGSNVLRDDGTYGPALATRKNALVIEADFYTDTSPYSPSFVGAAISGGTDNVIAGEANHPGVIDLRDGTTANGGWNISTAANAFLLAGGEKSVITFQIRNARATANGWMGFKDNTTNAQPVDGAYVYFVGNGTAVTMDARTRSNSTETINGTTWSPTLNTWYTLVITVNSAGTQVDYEVFNDAGVSQWAVNNTANIPTGAGRQTGFGIQCNESTTDAAAAIMYIDYARMKINRTLTR